MRSTRPSIHCRALAALCLALAQPVAADGERWPLLSGEGGKWAGCIAPLEGDVVRPTEAPPPRTGAALEAEADHMDYDGGTGTHILLGNVRLERADQRLASDAARYAERDGRVDARGNIRYQETGLQLGADQGFLLLDRDQGELDRARYLIPETLTQGEADRIRLLDSKTTEARGTTYSTCEPGNETWMVRADRIRIDRETGVGEAWHARLNVHGFPVAYTPYANFPIDDRRKSGFLPATIGQSERSGTDITVPYYWNIAPNYDATLTPRYLSRRGPLLGGQFRYLQDHSSGDFEGTYLPDDAQAERDRWLFGWNHETRFTRSIRGDIDFNRVSDEEYFRDFGGNLRTSTTRNLRSRGRLRYNTRTIDSSAEVERYQTVDPGVAPQQRPYQRLPRVTFAHRPGPGPLDLDWRLDSEVVRFDHPSGGERDRGVRADLAPRVSLPLATRATYLTPALTVRHTEYDLDRAEIDTTDRERISRTVPIASLDTGIFLERPFDAFGQPLRQTLEPRLFYLYAPERDQDDIPLFDTRRADPSLFQFFQEDRFLGPDRIGDANQVTAALTSRFLNRETGREFLRLGVAQIHYFDDRQVTLNPDDPPEIHDRSDVIGEARLNLPGGLRVDAQGHWNPETRATTLGSARVAYQPRSDAVLAFSHRARRDRAGERELEQRDVMGAWPLGQRWHVLGGWRYSVLEERTLEGFGGLQYRDCCWSVRLLGRAYQEEADMDREQSIMLQFELRGLGSVGDDVQQFLEDSIFGYGQRY